MTALAIWCGPRLEPTFLASAYRELCEACKLINENGSERTMGVLVCLEPVKPRKKSTYSSSLIKSLLPILKSLVSSRYPHVEGCDAPTAKISIEGEDMLFALLGGQVDQKAVSPTQGPLMQPALHQELPVPPPNPTAMHQNGNLAEPFDANNWPIPDVQMALPVVNPDPSSHNPDVEEGEVRVEDLSSTELWARLQTFYEPTPAYWGQSAGFVDYSSALGAMGMS